MTIYFIENKRSKAVKIGFTDRDPLERLVELQAGLEDPLRILGTRPGTLQTEQRLHHLCYHLRLRGELFKAPCVQLCLVFLETYDAEGEEIGVLTSILDTLYRAGKGDRSPETKLIQGLLVEKRKQRKEALKFTKADSIVEELQQDASCLFPDQESLPPIIAPSNQEVTLSTQVFEKLDFVAYKGWVELRNAKRFREAGQTAIDNVLRQFLSQGLVEKASTKALKVRRCA